MVFTQSIYVMAMHFPDSEFIDVSTKWVNTFKVFHMRLLNASVFVLMAYMELSECPAASACLAGAAIPNCTWVSVFTPCYVLIAGFWWFVCTLLMLQLYVLLPLDAYTPLDVLLSHTQEISISHCICVSA